MRGKRNAASTSSTAANKQKSDCTRFARVLVHNTDVEPQWHSQFRHPGRWSKTVPPDDAPHCMHARRTGE